MAPLSEKTLALISEKNMDKESPILIRIFKEEAEMEVWKRTRESKYALLKTYPVCKWSGNLGPKKKEGDRQAPEGFYTITPAQMNPNSNYYLAFNTGFPNVYDRAHGYTGSELMVHGDCSSRGCYAMTDEQIQEIYALARESFFGGQKQFQFEAFPFRMTALNMAKHRNNPNFEFWKMLKEGYDDFEATRQEPKIAVCEKRYVFDAAPRDGAKGPLRFNANGKCPAYQLDPTIASTVTDYRQQQQVKMANYIANRVATVAPHEGDGGMNPVFMAQLSQPSVDNSGRYTVASLNGISYSSSHVPGALPHVPNPPGTTIPKVGIAKTAPAPAPATEPAQANEPAPANQPVTMASVPTPAPLPKEGQAPQEEPTNIANLFGNFFKRNSQAQRAPTQVAGTPLPAQPGEPVALRGGAKSVNVEMAAKPKRAEKTQVAAAPVTLRPATPHQSALPKSAAVAKADSVEKPQVAGAPAAKLQVKVAAAAKVPPSPAPEQHEIRTAYSGTTNGIDLLAGAQPVVPTGSFNSFR